MESLTNYSPDLLLVLFGAIATFYVVYAEIFLHIRIIGGKLFECPLCLGFWAGFILQMPVVYYTPFPADIIACIANGLFTGFTAFGLYTVVEWLEVNIKRLER